MSETRAELRTVYAAGLPPQLMRERKRDRIRSPCAHPIARLRAQWGGHAPFEPGSPGDLNNAHLASIATYFACVPGFERELEGGGRQPCRLLPPRGVAQREICCEDIGIAATGDASRWHRDCTSLATKNKSFMMYSVEMQLPTPIRNN